AAPNRPSEEGCPRHRRRRGRAPRQGRLGRRRSCCAGRQGGAAVHPLLFHQEGEGGGSARGHAQRTLQAGVNVTTLEVTNMPSFVLRRSIIKPKGPFVAEPQSVQPVGQHRPLPKDEIFLPEMVGRNCHLQHYKKVPVPAVDIDQEIIAYCSPDSTYAVTKRLFDDAKKSILIGIYDFSADYMKALLLDALKRGVKVTLMLDIDSKEEQQLFNDLTDSGVDGVPAPSCASHRVHFFSSSHEKVIVVDDEWCLVQSGNYSENSIPLNVKDGGDRAHFRSGNRDTGLAIRSKKLAKFLTTILDSDMALELNGPEALAQVAQAVNAFLIEAAPTKVPDTLFPSKTFKLTKALNIQSVLSPDNYMDVIPNKLRAAKKSILIEQQYIRGDQ